MRLIGMTDPVEWNKAQHRKRVSAGMRKKWQERTNKRLWEARSGRKRYKGELGKYKHAMQKCKRKYRKMLQEVGYLEFGLVPHTGDGRRRGEYEISLNLLALGYDIRSGRFHRDRFVRGRWDLEQEDWLRFWGTFPEELRQDYRLVRIDPRGSYSGDNMQIERKPTRKG